MGLQEFRQALWQDMKSLEENGIEFIKDGQLFAPLTNQYGEPVHLVQDGRARDHWTTHAHDIHCRVTCFPSNHYTTWHGLLS
jgi:hypothetical protein